MSPPTPVFSRKEIEQKYAAQLNEPEKYQCTLKSLTQNECTFKLGENSRVVETLCVPFKRIFQRCLVPHTILKNGRKTVEKRWINIEITLASSNDDLKSVNRAEILEFMRAELDLQKWIQSTELEDER